MNNIITDQQVRSWAKQIADELTFAIAISEPKTFTHYFSDNDFNLCFEAEVEYACEVWEDEGINDTPPSYWSENEQIIIHQVIDQYDRQRPAIAERLEWYLN